MRALNARGALMGMSCFSFRGTLFSLNALLSWRARRMPARVWAVGRSSYDCAGLISKSDEPDWLQEQRWRKILFITQGFDGIQPGCPIGRIETEKQSHRQ